MEKPSYAFQISENHEYYFFESIGKTNIQKIVVFQPSEVNPDIVELAFGNLKTDLSIDVFAVDDNEDMPIVISTVITTIFDYLEYYPEKTIYFSGSTPSRTRLYRAAIAKSLEKIESNYQVFGLKENTQIESFDKHNTYLAFLIKRKNGE
ncbi:MAG: hypothetical protein MUF58_15730 [Arcicella sp.]|jgi:hypothetical protein|nr:hypothetical protein [Arcicella sp.]